MASKSLGTLTVDLIAKVGGFVSGMSKADRESDKTAKNIIRRQKQIEKAAYDFGVSIGQSIKMATAAIAAGGVALGVYAKSVINDMDEISKASQKAGMSTESFSRLNYAASLADVDMSTLVTTMGKLTKNQGEVAMGNTKMADAFKALGINAIDPVTKKIRDGGEVLKEFADVFVRNAGSPEVMALGFQIFGRSFQEIIPMIKDGAAGISELEAAADRLGITLTTSQGQAAEAFNDSFTVMSAVVKGLAQDLISDLLPSLTQTSQEMTANIQTYGQMSDVAKGLNEFVIYSIVTWNKLQNTFEALKGFVQSLVYVFMAYADTMKNLGLIVVDVIVAIGKGLYNLATFNFSGLVQNSKEFMSNIVGRFKAIDDAATNSADLIQQTMANQRKAMAQNNQDIANGAKRWAVFGNNASNALNKAGKTARTMNEALGLASGKSSGGIIMPTKPVKAPKSARVGGGGGGGAAKISEEDRAAQRLADTYHQLTEDMQEREALIGKTSETAKLQYRLEQGDLKGLDDAQKQILLTGSQRIEMLEKEEEARKAAADEAARLKEDAKNSLDDLKFEISLAGKSREEQEQMNLARRLGNALTQEHINLLKELQVAQAVSDVRQDMQDMQAEFEVLGKTADERERINYARRMGLALGTAEGKQALSNLALLQEATKQMNAQVEVADAVRGAFSDSLKGLVKGTMSWKDAILNVFDAFNDKVLDMISQNWTEKLFGGQGGIFGGLLGGSKDSPLNKLNGGLAGGMDMNAAMAQMSSSNLQAGTALTGSATALSTAAASLQSAAMAISSSAGGMGGAIGGLTDATSSLGSTAGTLDQSTGQFNNAMTGGAPGGGGGFLGWIKGLFGGGSGGGGIGGWLSMLGGLFGGGMATGGWALPNSLYQVNEKGPELFTVNGADYMMTGRKGVEVTPNHRLSGGGSQTNNFIVQGRIDRRTQEQIAMQVGRKASQASRRNS